VHVEAQLAYARATIMRSAASRGAPAAMSTLAASTYSLTLGRILSARS
jgi:hypothetical protein